MEFTPAQMITDKSGGEGTITGDSDSKKRKRPPHGPAGGLRATVTQHFTGGTGESGFTFLGGSVGAGNWLELGPTPFSQGGAIGALGGKPAGQFKAPMKPFRRPGETSSAGSSGMPPPQRRYPGQVAAGKAGTPASYYEQNTPRYNLAPIINYRRDNNAPLCRYRNSRKREGIRTRQREARQKGITLLRKYRTGDLPDVAIKPSEILSPLMALSLVDSSLAQSLFSELFVSIFHSVAEEEKYASSTVNNN